MSRFGVLKKFSNKKNQGYLEKLILWQWGTIESLGQRIGKMSPEHLTVPESKKVLKKNDNDENMSKRHRSQLKQPPMAKVEII